MRLKSNKLFMYNGINNIWTRGVTMGIKLKIVNKHILLFVMAIIMTCLFTKECFATNIVRVFIDGKEFISEPSPFIDNGRILVPIRFISEELGGEVLWDNNNRTVTIKRKEQQVKLKIDSHLVVYEKDGIMYGLTDVAPKIVEDRTYVPIRLVINALGVDIEWDPLTRTAFIDTRKKTDIVPFFDVKVTSVNDGQIIEGKTKLQAQLSKEYIEKGNEVKYLLLDPDTASGFVVARGNDLSGQYIWLPDMRDNGDKVLVAAIYDEKGNFIGGDAINVKVKLNPQVEMKVLTDEASSTVSLSVDTNFVATKVEYEVTNLETGNAYLFGQDAPIDPYGEYLWKPTVSDSGSYSFKAIAYDTNGEAHVSPIVNESIIIKPKLALTGVSEGQTIDKPVTLLASRNFDVKNTKYILIDSNTGNEIIINERPYGSYQWFPSPELQGNKKVLVEVEDTKGLIYRSQPVTINIKGEPILLLDGVGPNQVLTGPINLKVRSNVNLSKVSYVLVNQQTGQQKLIASNVDPSVEITYIPTERDIGFWKVKALSEYNNKQVSSAEVPIRVYLGKTYKAVSIVDDKDYVNEFIKLSSKLAVNSWKQTGMSAALQTAQSILETGWGRSVPVDKYSGKLSYNLFGIKGEGPAGSVIYNTWEVYNGNKYYVDAKFRAYNSIEESWADHKSFLLNSKRYEPFKEVMYDYVQGAWALKRSGYATDPEYATKLMRIINQYNLRDLDKVGI